MKIQALRTPSTKVPPLQAQSLRIAARIALAAVLCAPALFLSSCTLDDFVSTDGQDTLSLNSRVVLGLRTALKVGIDSSAGLASQVDGYLANKAIKILLPDEAAQALQAAQNLAAKVRPFTTQLEAVQGLALAPTLIDGSTPSENLSASSSLLGEIDALPTLSDSLIKYMNRAAEYAAPRSVPIFKDAITGMSLTDGLTLLDSPDSTAATQYLNGRTFSPLVSAYTPIVDSTLTLVPLTQYWGQFRDAYNSILSHYNQLLGFQNDWNSNAVVATFPSLQITALSSVSYKPIQTESLGAWTTDKALTGLFYLVGNEEKKVRRDPFGYVKNLASDVGDLLSEVFGKIMQMGAK